MPKRLCLALFLITLLVPAAQAQQPWSTFRGNLQRTGNIDNMPGPTEPKVLWVMKSTDHYIASPVPVGNRLIISGLGGFNAAVFASLDCDVDPAKRTVWAKAPGALKQATVSSPAVVEGKLIFGDGMHQNSGAVLHCLDLATGKNIWRLPMPGELVHLEGSPSVEGKIAYLGGGSAGVIAVDIDTLTLKGKVVLPAEITKIHEEERKVLQAKYELAKKDPKTAEFAREPTDDDLSQVEPKLLWQQGKGKWHVDAPVAVVKEKVLVCSAYLDKEKEGDRALFCLDAKTGTTLWKEPLKLNPWGGVAVSGNTVVVTTSSMNYDFNLIARKPKGQVLAFDLDKGKPKWSKEIKAGVVSCAAIAGDTVIATATDGKVRAYDLETGDSRWIYDTKDALFAPVAVAGNSVYAVDLRGVIHAIDLKSGNGQWTFDTAKAFGSPSMVHGGPVVQGGRLYVATNNLDGPNQNKATGVICIGAR